jgi:hypothetical protein
VGLRRPDAWSALRPRAVDATLAGLRRAFPVVVADVTGDLEGETHGGSLDVEERNHLSRAAVGRADAVVVVGAPGLKGVHSLAWLVREVLAAGASPARVLPVVNRAARHPGARAGISRALALLLAEAPEELASPVFVPERKVEEALRDGTPLPAAVVAPVAGAVRAVLERNADAPPPSEEPTPITPGSLGSWSEADADTPEG